jgi:hypothetical protein
MLIHLREARSAAHCKFSMTWSNGRPVESTHAGVGASRQHRPSHGQLCKRGAHFSWASQREGWLPIRQPSCPVSMFPLVPTPEVSCLRGANVGVHLMQRSARTWMMNRETNELCEQIRTAPVRGNAVACQVGAAGTRMDALLI